MIELENVAQTYRSLRSRLSALTGINARFPQGGITAVIGPNGSGKSTLLRLLATVERPTSGDIYVDGQPLKDSNLKEFRRVLGYVPQDVRFVPTMTATEALHYAGWVAGLGRADYTSRAREVLRQVVLEEKATQKVSSLSGGQTRRLGVAAALLHNPRYLVLDEPTAGLDPQARYEVRTVIENLDDEVTVIMSTHVTDDVEKLSDSVLALSKGKVTFSGPWEELKALAKDSEAAGLSNDPLEQALSYLGTPSSQPSPREGI